MSMGPHSRCVRRFVFGCGSLASSAEHFNVIAVECLVFALMCLKSYIQICIHCVYSGSWAWLARCPHSCNSSHFFCVAMCLLQVRALQADLETSGSAFPEAMMGKSESSERYLPKILIEKSQKIDSIGNRKT